MQGQDVLLHVKRAEVGKVTDGALRQISREHEQSVRKHGAPRHEPIGMTSVVTDGARVRSGAWTSG
eukprot:COSAG05_NODE_3051_length_2382_cov_2.250986_2_plen_66_part_00